MKKRRWLRGGTRTGTSRIAQPKGSPCVPNVQPILARNALLSPQVIPSTVAPSLSLRYFFHGSTFRVSPTPTGTGIHSGNGTRRNATPTDRNTCVKQIRVIALPVCHNPLPWVCLFILFLDPRYRQGIVVPISYGYLRINRVRERRLLPFVVRLSCVDSPLEGREGQRGRRFDEYSKVSRGPQVEIFNSASFLFEIVDVSWIDYARTIRKIWDPWDVLLERIFHYRQEIDIFFLSMMNDTLYTLLLTIGIYICPYIMATRIAHDPSTTFTFLYHELVPLARIY